MVDTTPMTDDIVIARDEHGVVYANVDHTQHHSPDGFEIGYGGSGPADLALSILNAVVPPGHDGLPSDKTSYGQPCSATAWRLHQPFKREFLTVTLHATESRRIKVDDILNWIESKTQH